MHQFSFKFDEINANIEPVTELNKRTSPLDRSGKRNIFLKINGVTTDEFGGELATFGVLEILCALWRTKYPECCILQPKFRFRMFQKN